MNIERSVVSREIIKRVLNSLVRFNGKYEGYDTVCCAYDHVVSLFAAHLKRQFPELDTEQFLKDCKYQTPVTKADEAVGIMVSSRGKTKETA